MNASRACTLLLLGLLAAVAGAALLRSDTEGTAPSMPSTGPAANDLEQAPSPSIYGRRELPAELEAKSASAPSPTEDDEPRPIALLPEDLRQHVTACVQHCRHACSQLGITLPPEEPQFTAADAAAMVAAERTLAAELQAHFRRREEVLEARFLSQKSPPLRVPAGEGAKLKAELEARHEGFPEGYLFFEESDGREIRAAAWRIDGDEELMALQMAGDALTGNYSFSRRASYRQWFRHAAR